MAGARRTDWDAVKAAYLAEFAANGAVDVKGLATRFKVNYGSLRNKISEQKWPAKARELHDQAEAKVRQKILPEIVDRRLKAMRDHLNYVEFLKKKAMQQLIEADKLPLALAMKTVFEAMRIEAQLIDGIAEATPRANVDSRDELVTMFREFVERAGLEIDSLTPGADELAQVAPPDVA